MITFLTNENQSGMNDKNKTSTPEENFSFAVQELTAQNEDRQKTLNDLLSASNAIIKKLDDIDGKIERAITDRLEMMQQTIDKKLDAVKGNRPSENSLVIPYLKTSILELKTLLLKRQEGQTKKIQILLFPEQDAELFYKIVFGRWFLMIVIALFLRIAYQLISRQQGINKEIELQAQKNNPVIKAWDYLYIQKNKTLHKQMDSALIKTTKVKEQQ